MKVNVCTSDLATALKAVAGSIGNSNMQVLESVLLDAAAQEIISTDLSITTIAKCKMDVIEDGRCLVPYKKLAGIAANAGDVIIIEGDDNLIRVQAKGKYQIPSQAAINYPKVNSEHAGNQSEIDSAAFFDALGKVAYCAGINEPRYALNSIYINNQHIVATDGARMALVPFKLLPDCSDGLIIPIKAIKAIKALRGKITISYTDKYVSFSDDTTHIQTRLIDGSYPPYNNVIPVTDSRIALQRQELIDAVKSIAIDGDRRQMYLDSKDGGLLVYIKESDISAEIFCSAVIDREIKITLSPKFLLETLNAIDSDELAINYIHREENPSVLSPLLIYGNGDDRHIMMPMRRD